MVANHLLKIKRVFKTQVQETGQSKYIYHNELDKACFQQDMAYEDSKDLSRRTAVLSI